MATRRGRALATVMFTDIVSSSTISESLGDAKWRVLLGRHNELIRRDLGRYGGRELDTAGDGFFAAFDDPVAAVRCAAAIAEDVQTLGLDVRVGLHFGRIEQMGRKPGGVVVHIGARVMGLAGPAEVLVTGVLRDLIPGGGFRFEDRGRQSLKGISEGSSIYRLVEVDRRPLPGPLDPDHASGLRDRIEAPPFLRRRRAPLLGGAATLVLVGALLVILLSRGEEPVTRPPTPPPPYILLKLDPATLKVQARIPLGHPLSGLGSRSGRSIGTERAIAVGPEGSVWVTNGDDDTITRVDPATSRATTIRLPAAPRSVAVGPGAVWVAVDGRPVLYRIDPASLRVDGSVHLNGLAFDVVVDQGSGAVWALGNADVELIDPSSNTVTKTIPIPGLSPAGPNLGFFPFVNLRMAIDGGSLWVPLPNGNLVRVDEEAADVADVRHLAERLGEVAVDGSSGLVWVTATKQGFSVGELIQLEPAKMKVKVTDTLGIGCCPGSVAVGEGAVWITDERNGTLTRILSASGAAESPLQIAAHLTSVAVGGGAVWVTSDPPR